MQWRAILRWFARGVPSAQIAHETRLDRKRVLRALTVVRKAMLRDGPMDVSSKRQGAGANHPAVHEPHRVDDRPRAATPVRRRRPPALGFYIAAEREWVDIIRDSEAEHLGRLPRHGRSTASMEWPAGHRYVAIVYRGRLYRLRHTTHEKPALPFGRIEAFWSYLQRQLRSKGGIRRERLGLYLAEYVWRYHRRTKRPAELVSPLMKLIREYR
jgi:hemin uptake protein HemP